MSASDDIPDDRAPDEIDLLLPWHATERLSPDEMERVEAALARDPARASHLAIAREEWAETVALNQDLGAPSRTARDALFARIEAQGRKPATSGSLARRISAWLASLAPGTLAWSSAAAAVVITLQAGFLARAYLAQTSAIYETASGPDIAATQAGAFVLVAFTPTATAARIDALLRDAQAVIVDGPRAGDLYRLRLTGVAATTIERLKADSAVVKFLIPEGDSTKP